MHEAASRRLILDLAPPNARITLSNPPVNVIDIQMMEELAATLSQIEERADVATVHVRGSGKCFSAGVDVAAHEPAHVVEMLEKFHAVIRAFVSSRKVVVAEVYGSCLGGGAELAMVCDLVYTAHDAVWGFPEIKLGCFPPVAVTALASLIPPKCAAELILTGETFSGAKAHAIGLATRAVAREELETTVQEALERLHRLSASTLALTKKAIYAWDAIHFDKGLARAEKIYLNELIKTEDAQEGIRAFLEKRDPRWKNR